MQMYLFYINVVHAHNKYFLSTTNLPTTFVVVAKTYPTWHLPVTPYTYAYINPKEKV